MIPIFKLFWPLKRSALSGSWKKNGNISHILADYIPDFDGSVKGFSIQSSEVTFLKETAAQLKLAACVFDSTLDGILITDGSGIIVSVNPAFSHISGYNALEAIGQILNLTVTVKRSILHVGKYNHAGAVVWRNMESRQIWRSVFTAKDD
jgi:PAS domain-containing protein